MNKFNYKYLTPFKWFVLENFPFIEADFDALTEWQLFCKLGKEINKIIDSQNVVGTQMENVTNAFIELQNYVNNYFDNLNVQDEINNKLNQMAESGKLSEIIAQYLQVAGLLCFNSVNEMKNATNLVNGSFVKTFGYYNLNDGGSALYKIRNVTNQDVADDSFIIALNDKSLVAELVIESNVNVLQFGAKRNDNSFDNGSIINHILEKINVLFFPKGDYYFTTHLTINKSDIIINGEFPNLIYNGSDYFIRQTTTNEYIRTTIQNLIISGNTENNCFNLNRFIDSSISNIRIQNFDIAITCEYSWDSKFTMLRIHNCTRPLMLGSQFNNISFINCSFSSFTKNMILTNCEAVSFINCDFTNNTSSALMTFFQSSINFMNCYFENLLTNRTIRGGYNETIKSCVIFEGGKITDKKIEIDIYEGELTYFNMLYGKLVPVAHKNEDTPAVGENIKSLNVSNNEEITPYNSVVYFDGVQNPNLTAYQTSQLSKVIENGIMKLTIPDNSTDKYAGLVFNIEEGHNYLLELEGKFEDDSPNIMFAQFLDGIYSVNRSLSNNKLIIPFYAYTTRLYLRWSTTATLDITKLKIKKLD